MFVCMFVGVHAEHLSMMMRHVFETHQPSNPVEELLKAAATGDMQTVDEVNSSRVHNHTAYKHMS